MGRNHSILIMAKITPTREDDQPQGGWINEPGRYKLRLDSIEEEISKSGGNEMLVLTLVDVDTGAKVRDRLVATTKAFWKWATFAKACGVQIAEGEELEIDQSWIGKTLEADVKMVQGDSKEFAEIDRYVEIVDSLFTNSKSKAKPAAKSDDGDDW